MLNKKCSDLTVKETFWFAFITGIISVIVMVIGWLAMTTDWLDNVKDFFVNTKDKIGDLFKKKGA